MSEPLLAIDIGNTRVKWGWRGDARWHAVEACAHDDFAARFGTPDVGSAVRLGAIWCSVASDAVTHQVLGVVHARVPALRLERFEVGPRVAGVDNRYRSPALGADRLAAAIGARAHGGAGPLVVASFGTATTIDTVSHDDVYLGGVIVPGIDLMLASLAQGTARLPQIEAPPGAPAQAFPIDTDAAIVEGVLRAQSGAFGSTWRLALERYGIATAVVTGGSAPRVTARLRAEIGSARCVLVDNLVLDGLVRTFVYSALTST